MKPKQFTVATEEHSDDCPISKGVRGECGCVWDWGWTDYADRDKAIAFADAKDYPKGVVYERYDFEDVTPAGNPRGLIWEYKDRCVWP